MAAEQPLSAMPSAERPSRQPPTLRTHTVSLLLFLGMLGLLFFMGSGCHECNCFLSLYRPTPHVQNMPAAIRSPNVGEAWLFLDVMTSGIYTPTDDGFIIPHNQTEPLAVNPALLAAEGYVAVRVPHAPPTYTVSSLMAGQQNGEPGAFFRYFSPPTSTVATRVPVTLTRRAELEPVINARFPITDGRSHWEVWWLPAGAKLPMPPGPFLLGNEFPAPFSFEFRADFGPGAEESCSGCPYQYAVFDGKTLFGPYDGTLVYGNDTGKALATFGAHCTHFPPAAPMVSTVFLTPGESAEFIFCLENYDVMAHTFTVNTTSERGWTYTFYTQTVSTGGQPAAPPVLVGVGPFAARVSGAQQFNPGMLIIYASTTPTFTADASVREVLHIAAQAVVSPTLRAETRGVGFSAQYDPELAADRKTYLPTVTKH